MHATILIQLHWPLQHERQARVTAEPSIISSAIIAWRDAFTAFVRMPATFGVATLLMFVLRLATLGPLTPVQPAFDVGFLLLLFASGMVSCLLLTPAAVAVHRYVLLGEITSRYRFSSTKPRFQRFFLFAVVFQFLLVVPFSLAILVNRFGGAWFVFMLIVFVALVAVTIVTLRTLILFPAIAVDAPGTQWRNALSDTKGHSCLVFFIFVCATVPAFVVGLPLEWLVRRWTAADSTVLMLVKSVTSVVMIAVFAAAASRLYWAFAERLGRPPEAATGPV